MTVALLNIRFEICNQFDSVPDIKFSAKGFVVSVDSSVNKPSYASIVQEETPPPTPDEERSIGLGDYRGCRKPHEIQIETYNCEDFDLLGIEEYLEASHSSMTSYLASETDAGVLKKDLSVRKAKSIDKDEKEQKELLEKVVTDSEHVSEKVIQDSGVRPKSQSPTPKAGLSAIHFYSGNPAVEKVKGILHIYKDNHLTSLSEETQRSELICMLAVPAKYTIHDLLKFNGPCLSGIEYMRIIRDGSPNQYMVLVKFRNQKLADEYYTAYNNTTFNSIETDICHLVYVGRVEMLKESENACLPVPGMTELPNCPVCLERMDESVDGILTILCNHAFHMQCLDQWGDTSCPVCRYCQTPEEAADNRCMKCGSQESLWICLICGNIGCGRYVGLHAFRHFQETHHTYAMELGNNKVWDYIGDNYVHRLVQNKSDGKLVQVDEGGNPVENDKMDALNLEYTYLLTNQLESQRLYFEDKMEEVEKTVLGKVHLLEEENLYLAEQCSHLHATLEASNKEKQLMEKKCNHLQTRLKKALHDLQEEKEMNKCLLDNQKVWQKRVTTIESEFKDFTTSKDKEIQELREQLRDVMFYVEAQGKLKNAEGVSQEEIQGSQVVVGASSETSPQNRKTRKKQR
ncbi:BRCA1-associated protein-like [Ruditapes philippinarum]|uniref:BRCA1-associated protein-like n=1 Tax=Ruditapes philippinarum TaxID=129788 RepID=UPI00295B0A06|nr:BRCA1-associated protein-like [Ruditapes philippinarum]